MTRQLIGSLDFAIVKNAKNENAKDILCFIGQSRYDCLAHHAIAGLSARLRKKHRNTVARDKNVQTSTIANMYNKEKRGSKL